MTDLIMLKQAKVRSPVSIAVRKARPHEIDRGPDRLRPEGDGSHRIVELCPVGDEAVLLDKVARELGETVTLAVTVKDRPEDRSQNNHRRVRRRRSSRTAC